MRLFPSLFYGWIVTGCAFIVLFATYGVQYSFGVFLPAMVDELGWQRASLGGAFSLYTMVYSGCSWISGRLTDTAGPRWVIAAGGVLLGGGIIATSQMSAQWQLYVCYGLIAALGMSSAYIPCNTTVVKWFQRKRGLALGLAASGSSCGILVCPWLAAVCIARWGWRPVYLACGIIIMLLLNGLARFMVRSPEQLGLAPDGERLPQSPAPPTPDSETVSLKNWTLQEARTTRSFWLLAVTLVVTFLTVPVPFVHIVVFAQDLGLSHAQGALAVSAMGMSAVLGNLSLGPLSDRIGRRTGLAIALSVQIAAYLLFFSAQSRGGVYAGAVAFGFFYGGLTTLLPALVGDFFGRLHAGSITGFLFAGAGILGAWGPMIAGYLRDVSGSYKPAFLYSALTGGVALLFLLLTPRPTVPRSPGISCTQTV